MQLEKKVTAFTAGALLLGLLIVVEIGAIGRGIFARSTDAVQPNGAAGRMAQGGPGMRGRMMDRMAQELSLTEPQKAQIKSIQDEDMPKMRALRDNTSLPREQKMAQMRQMRDASQTRINQVLTPDQQSKFAAMRQRMGGRGGMGGGMGGPPGAPRPGAAR